MELFRTVTGNLGSVLTSKCNGKIPDKLVKALYDHRKNYNRIFENK